MTTNTELKTAAIWARVSTKSQDEISPSSQISRCRDLLEQKGYKLIKTFSVVYCSLELDSAFDAFGEPSEDRTRDHLIKSQILTL